MKRWFVVVVIFSLLGSTLYFAFGRDAASVPGPSVEASDVVPPVRAGNLVVAEARVIPLRSAELSLPVAGRVAEVAVVEGEQVTAGQVLMRLDARKQAAAVAQAEAEVQRARARLAELKAGSRPQEIAAAQAAVEVAQAQLAKLKEGPRPEELAAAQAETTSAQEALQKVQQGPTAEERIMAKAELKRTEIALQKAQAEYDPVAYRNDVGALPEAAQLQQATVDHERALAAYSEATKDADPADVAAAAAKVADAKASLANLRQGPTPSEIAGAEAEVRRAQAQLDLLQAGERSESIAMAEADVAAANAALQQAQGDMADTELRAPFAGIVAAVDVKADEQVAPGVRVASLGDLSEWEIETKDLTELGIVNVQVGSPVTITVDAIPDLALGGTVTRIKALGENQQGDIVYTVQVKPNRQDPRLRWNMTTSVQIDPGEKTAAGQPATPVRATVAPLRPTLTPTAVSSPIARATTVVITPAPMNVPKLEPTTLPTTPAGAASDGVVPPQRVSDPVEPGQAGQDPASARLEGKLVFQTSSGGDIYVVNADGSGLRYVTTGLDPALSPDGRQIAFARWEGIPRGLFAINVGGSNERLVFGWDKAGLKAPTWAPGGDRLAFTYQTGGDTRLQQCFKFPDPATGKKITKCFTGPRNPLWKVASVGIGGDRFQELLCHDFSYSPTWAADGRRIAYSSDQGLFLTGEESGMGRTADDPLHWMLTDFQGDRSPAWSPDGRRVAFQTKSHDHWEIAVIDGDGQGRAQLTRSWPLADTPINCVAPAWSPDGRWIVYLTDARGRWELWRMRADGRDQAPFLEEALKGITFRYENVDERVVSWGL